MLIYFACKITYFKLKNKEKEIISRKALNDISTAF